MVRSVINVTFLGAMLISSVHAAPVGNIPWSAKNGVNGVAGLDTKKNIQTAPVRKSVLIGSARTADMILLEKNADVLINSGRVGLYGHWNAMYSLTTADLAAIGKYWAPTQSGFGGYGNFQAEAELGAWTDFSDGTIQAKYGGQLPQEINVNLYNAGAGDDSSTYVDPANGKTYACYSTAKDLQTVKASVDAMFAVGAKNYAVVSSPNCGTVDFDQPFATGDFWANTRAMALYGGGITMDTSPGLFFNHQSNSQYGDTDIAAKYTDMVAQMIRWGNQQGLRTTIIMPPNANNPNESQFDPNYINAAMTEVDYLRANDAIPSEFVVEQYGLTDNGANAPWGDYVAGSMNRLARYLLTVKTPDGGSTAPQAPGGLPGNQLMTVDTPYTPATQIPDAMGSLGQQNTNDVHIHTGYIGDLYSNDSTINITLASPTSSFFSVVPLTLQGAGTGNPVIGSGTSDSNLHIYNPYTSDHQYDALTIGQSATSPTLAGGPNADLRLTNTPTFALGSTHVMFDAGGSNGNPQLMGNTDGFIHITNPYVSETAGVGLVWGSETTAPSITRSPVVDLQLMNAESFGFGSAQLIFNAGGNNGNATISGNTDGLVHVANPYSSDPTKTGIALGNATSAPIITLDGSGKNIQQTNSSTIFQSSTFDYTSDSAKALNNAFVVTYNENNLGETDFISYPGSGVGGMQWYTYKNGTLSTNMTLSGDVLNVPGNIISGGSVQLASKSKAAILAISSPVEGSMVNDSDDHVPVIYENGAWYPVTLGTALSN